jgi:hypothetical protein
MNTSICLRLGSVAGGFVGVILSLVHLSTAASCCGTPVFPPTFARLALDGMIVALIVVFLAAAFTCLVTHLPFKPVFVLAIYIGILTGVLLGPPAYHIHNPGLAFVVCAFLGAFLGWLICRLLCGGLSALKAGVAR